VPQVSLGPQSGHSSSTSGPMASLSLDFHELEAATQQAHKRLVNVYITFTIAFRIGSECPFIERLVSVKRFLYHF